MNSGDIIFGDLDGVVVIPRKEEREVIERAYEKATSEKTVGVAIRGGISAVESFKIHGVM